MHQDVANDRHAARRVGDIDKYIGNRLTAARHAKGLTQKELAVEAGVTFQQIQKYEGGVNRVSVARLVQLARPLGKKIQWFIQGYEQ